MINFSNARLGKVIVHKLGNKNEDEGVHFSDAPLELQGDFIRSLLLKFFLSSFKNDAFFHFHHETDINLNDIYTYSNDFFENHDKFFDLSQKIANHLYEQSSHPKIKGGEFYAVIIHDCMIEDEIMDAIGVFKTENKDTYLRVEESESNFKIDFEDGININKLDKGCLIFNTEKESGFLLSMVDNVNKSKEAQYWKDDFLKVKAREDNYFFTDSYLHMCKSFAETGLENLEKNDQVALKNDTIQYFQEKESFNQQEFEEEVIANDDVAEVFKEYKQNYENDREISMSEDFEISNSAVKQSKGQFRSVIKLDKNFHIYIHGDREMAEKGYDEDKGKKYYKLFFETEK